MNTHQQTTPLHYAVAGSGPLVVLLHGLLMDGNSWVNNGLVDALSSHFTLVCPDLPGHGKSAKVASSACDGHSQADAIRDLIDELGFNQAHIVGYSTGAWLAIELLKHHPERLSSLVIGGWDVQNGLPEGPQGRLDFDAFFAFAQATAPALTHWVTQERLPTLRASFDALAGYQGQQDAPRVSATAIPKMFWAGEEDIYYSPLKGWAEHHHLPFYSATGDHVSAILNPAADLCQVIGEFLKKTASD